MDAIVEAAAIAPSLKIAWAKFSAVGVAPGLIG